MWMTPNTHELANYNISASEIKSDETRRDSPELIQFVRLSMFD